MNMLSSFEFSDRVVGIMVDGNINAKNIDKIHQVVLNRLELHNKINLFFEIPEQYNVSFPAFFKDILFKVENGSRFEKIAMVTDSKWVNLFSEMKDLLMDAEIKTFINDNRMKAMNWIMI